MAMAVDEKLCSLRERIMRFATQEVATRPELSRAEGFPFDIWEKMGRENLLGLCIPANHGGGGGNYLEMAVAGEALVARGHNLGLAVSWLIHHAVARFLVLGFGNKDQKAELLPKMATGQITACLAASEPGTGTHPRRMKTSARFSGGYYILNGEKAYLTNGPIAELFVVFAVTGENDGKKRITAFLVPKDAPGLSLTGPMDLDFLRPSPHCGIKLENCSVPPSAVLGQRDTAYEDMIKPFRELEDTLMMGPVAGGMVRQLEVLTSLVRDQKISISDELKEDLGRFQSLIHTLRIMAYEAAGMLDSDKSHPEFLPILLAGRALSKDAQAILKGLVDESHVIPDDSFEYVTHDIRRGTQIAQNVAKIKQRKLGERVLSGGEFYERGKWSKT